MVGLRGGHGGLAFWPPFQPTDAPGGDALRVLDGQVFLTGDPEGANDLLALAIDRLEERQRKKAEKEVKRKAGYAALDVMERHLKRREFFVAERYSIADIALYAYTHKADEGGQNLADFPAINAWFERVRTQPGHAPIEDA